MSQNITIRPSQKSDSDYILHCNKAIEGEHASLSEERLFSDILCDTPKAHINIFEVNNTPVGLIFYSHTYWASRGLIMWISQMYLEPEHRGRHIYQLKRWLEEKAAKDGAALIVWGTIATAKRTNRLWKAAGANNINDDYQFWVKKINKG